MRQFILRRLGLLAFVLFAVTFLTFAAQNVVGDPLFNLVGPISGKYPDFCEQVERGEVEDDRSAGGNQDDCEIIADARDQNNLDRPVIVRYGLWVGDFVTGDFGESFVNGDKVSDLVKDRLPTSLKLLIYAQVVSLGIAIPWGVATARRANRRFDRASTVGSFGMLAIPNFALAVILLFLLAFRWEIFPAAYNNDSWWDEVKSLFLPALSLGIPLAATYQRLLRTDLLTTLQEDFVHMARAKGMPPRHIMYRHALRPSMFSVITVFGVNTGALIGGSLVIERIFNIPGVGLALVEAILRDDPPVVLGLVAVIAVGFVVINFFVDLLYSWLDPRVRTT